MTITHPFDTTLARIDPDTRRITTDDIDTLPPGKHLNISVVLTATATTIWLDLRLQKAGSGRAIIYPPPGCDSLPSIGVMGTGVNEDGTLEPHTLAAAPCRCPDGGRDGLHWNPLALALLWHPALPGKVVEITRAYLRNIADNSGRYCLDGLTVIVAARAAVAN